MILINEKLLWKTLNKCNFNKENDFLETILTQAGIEDIYGFLHVNKNDTYEDYENYAEKHDMDVECDDLFCRGLDRAIEIVKRGGRKC